MGAEICWLDRSKVLFILDDDQTMKDRCLKELPHRRWRPDMLGFEIPVEDIPLLKETFQGSGISVDPRVVDLYRGVKDEGYRKVRLSFSTRSYQLIGLQYHDGFLNPKIRDVIEKYIDEIGCVSDMHQIDGFIIEVMQAGAELKIDKDVEKYIERWQSLQETDMNILKHPLRPYQVIGSLFMALNQRAICADEMGLGKSPEALAACLWMQEHDGAERVLIIAPASLLFNWESEIRKFTNESATIIDGGPKFRKSLYKDIRSGTDPAYFILINYEKIAIDYEYLSGIKWDAIVLDEGQKIKNRKAKQSKAIKRLAKKTHRRLVLTGTPLENRLEELYSLMEFVDTSIFGGYGKFMEFHYVFGGYKMKELTGYKNLETCNKKLRGAMIRRSKDDVAEDLPDKIIRDIDIPLTDYQEEIYRVLHKKMKKVIRSRDLTKIGAVFALMRMLCDDVELVKLSSSEMVDDMFDRDDLKQSSAKLSLLEEIVEEAMDSGQKVVIFTQWVRMAGVIEKRLKDNGHKVLYVDGSTPKKDRQWRVWRLWGSEDKNNEYYDSGPDDLDDYRILLTTDSLNYGQNLQCASILVNFEILFNPQKQFQRDARIHRIGADANDTKFIINFITKGTVEERTLELQREKKALFKSVIEDEVSVRSNLDLIIEVVEGGGGTWPN